MGYTCLKMATFGGVKYRPGDVVEAEMIQPGSARAMQDMGIIAEFQDLEVGKIETLTLPITAEGGVFLEDEAAKAVQEAPEGGSEGVS